MKAKGSRYLIDKIDRRLGGIEKELKFDKIVILVGLGIMIISALIFGFVIDSHPVLAIFSAMAFMFGLFLTYMMVKEYIGDLKRFKAQNTSAPTENL